MADASDVGERCHDVGCIFPFHFQVELMDHRKFRVWGKLHDVQRGRWVARSDYVRISGSSSLAGQQEYSALASWHSGAGDGAEDGRVDDPAIEDAVSSADDGLAITRQLIGGSNARTKVRAVGRQGSGAGQKRIGNLRGWQELGIPAQAEAQRQARPDSPVVLCKKCQIIRCELKSRRPEPLSEICVAVSWRVSGAARPAEWSGGCGRLLNEIADVVHARVERVCPELFEEVDVGVVYVVEVESELEEVRVVAPCDRVRNLVPALVRERRAVQEVGHAKHKPAHATDCNLRR